MAAVVCINSYRFLTRSRPKTTDMAVLYTMRQNVLLSAKYLSVSLIILINLHLKNLLKDKLFFI